MNHDEVQPYDEIATLNELVFVLGQRDEPTVTLVECVSLAKRHELEAQLAEQMPEYQFYALDVTLYSVESLIHILNQQLPEEIKASQPVSWVVHIHGLENSQLLDKDGQFVPSPMTARLNLERELLFRTLPYIIVLWGDAEFFRTLQSEAPDFWHWVTYRFRFEDNEARSVAILPPLPDKPLLGRGRKAERQARINELEERYEHLSLDDSDKKRLLKDKIDTLSLLGDEYTEAFLYKNAEKAYKTAIILQERIREGSNSRAVLWGALSNVYLEQNLLPEALEACEQCKSLASENLFASTFHLFGRIYQHQREWSLALKNYEQAIEWEQRFAEPNLGDTYHQIGRLYEEQQRWTLALNNYHKALQYRRILGDDFAMEGTYHQIGVTYQKQGQWSLALENFQQSLNWNERTGNEFGKGGTYYQISQVYEEQKLYSKSIPWLKKAIDCFTKYSDPFLGRAKIAMDKLVQLQQEKIRVAAVKKHNQRKSSKIARRKKFIKRKYK